MIVLDANILLYAYNTNTPRHEAAKRWLEHAFETEEWIGFPWLTLWAFIRIASNVKAFQESLSAAEALAIVRSWIRLPGVSVLEPGSRHLDLLSQIVAAGEASGALITDAALAAITIEHGATLISTDRDFARFPQLHWINPLA